MHLQNLAICQTILSTRRNWRKMVHQFSTERVNEALFYELFHWIAWWQIVLHDDFGCTVNSRPDYAARLPDIAKRKLSVIKLGNVLLNCASPK